MEIQFTFVTIVAAIIKLFVLVILGYLLYRRKIMDDRFTDMLSLLLIRIIFPALILAKTTTYFSFSAFSYWWLLPLASMFFSVTGVVLGFAVYPLLGGRAPKNEFVASCGFQNCGYLPMNIILFSFSGLIQDRLLIFLFLFITGFNLLMWSLMPVFLSGERKGWPGIKEVFNPPVVVTVLSLVWVWFFGQGSVPAVILDPVGQLGHASFPIAMITLGAYLARYNAHLPAAKLPVIAGVLTKLVIFPSLVLVLLCILPLGQDYKFFLFLQATLPTAVSLVVIGSYARSDNGYLSSIIFYTHIAALVTVPLWLGLFRLLVPAI
jgi:malate permease and related proteins